MLGVFLRASAFTLRLYSALLLMKRLYASDWAGLLGLGVSSKSCIPSSICFTVIAGRHPSSSFNMLRQIVPEGYTFGWKSGGTNLHLGGFEGYSSLNSSMTLYSPPAQSVPSFPGIPVSHTIMLDEPSALATGRAWNPYGWSLRHALRSCEDKKARDYHECLVI